MDREIRPPIPGPQLTGNLIQARDQTVTTFAESFRGQKQARHKKFSLSKIKKVPRINNKLVVLKQTEREILIAHLECCLTLFA